MNTPGEFALAQNYPNPFNPTTDIGFYIANTGHVNLAVYNMLGQQIALLVNGQLSEGKHSVTFNATDLPSGIYLYRLIGEHVNITKKMILQK